MAWTVELIRTAKKQLARIDRTWQIRVLDYLEQQIGALDDPRSRGKRLSHGMRALWRHRVGDYRLICDVRGTELVVLVVTIGHRSEVDRG